MKSSRLATLAGATGLVAALFALFFAAAPPADAHERRTVAGQYTFVVGFINEPAIAGQVNGIDLRITNAQNEPVEGVDKTLKADVSVGPEMKTYDITARFGQRGAYTATMIPTKAGVWTFRFYGDINGTPIDERFESGPGRFNDVQAASTFEFPTAAQARGDADGAAAASVTDLSAEAQRALDEAEDARSTGIAVGAAGIVAGLIGIGLAAVALTRRPRAAQPAGRPGGGTEPV